VGHAGVDFSTYTQERKDRFLSVFCTVGCMSLSTHTPAGWTCVFVAFSDG
jgi:hypothetical protein